MAYNVIDMQETLDFTPKIKSVFVARISQYQCETRPYFRYHSIDASFFTNVDAEVAALPTPLSHAEILMDSLDTEDGGNDDDDDGDNGVCDDEPVACPKYNDLLEMVEMMKQFSLFSKNGETVQSYANQLGRIVDEHFSAKKQSDIHDFFKKL